MPGWIDDDTGWEYGTGWVWLAGGLGTPGWSDPAILPETTMIAEGGDTMIGETNLIMWTE